MKDDRKPVYSKDRLRRVISVANGQWQMQQRGTIAGSKTFDPWFKCGLATTDFEITAMSMGGT